LFRGVIDTAEVRLYLHYNIEYLYELITVFQIKISVHKSRTCVQGLIDEKKGGKTRDIVPLIKGKTIKRKSSTCQEEIAAAKQQEWDSELSPTGKENTDQVRTVKRR
jgi:hypothetical protein